MKTIFLQRKTEIMSIPLDNLVLKMKSIIILLCVSAMMTIGQSLYAQLQYGLLGTAEIIPPTTTANPINISSARSAVSHFVYTKTELEAAGLSAGAKIKEIGWLVYSAPPVARHFTNYTISMKHVTVDNVAIHLGINNWNIVKNAHTLLATSCIPEQWLMFQFENEFIWNGTDNIGVKVCWTSNIDGATNAGRAYTYTSTNGYTFRRNVNTDNNMCSTIVPDLGIVHTKPHARMGFVSCVAPGTPVNVSATATGASTADLSWESGAPTGSPTVTYFWEVRRSTDNVVEVSGSTTNTSVNAQFLSCNTTYKLWVYAKTNCDNLQSDWVSSSNFTTDNASQMIVGAASASPTQCINTPLSQNITHTTQHAIGIKPATGLPNGVTAAWSANQITISGTPSQAGTFNYSIPLTGGCGDVFATGTIYVTPNNTASTVSPTPQVCNNSILSTFTQTTTGATGIGSPTGMPPGISAIWSNNEITFSGTPTTAGTYNYSIPMTGGCGTINAIGTIQVLSDAVTVEGAHSSSNGCYATLAAAFSAINGQNQTGNDIVIKINASTTETATPTLTGAGGMWKSLVMYPTQSNLSVSNNSSSYTINLQGARNVTIDGRVNLIGETPSLTIQNLVSSTADGGALSFHNNAENNIVRYCRLRSSGHSSAGTATIIRIGNGTTGASNNIIEFCNILTYTTPRPDYAIRAVGGSSSSNTNNAIRNNNFYNHHRTNSTSYGIFIGNYNNGTMIVDNNFYQTTTLSHTSAGPFQIYSIFSNGTASNMGNVIIDGNYFGGTEPECEGSALTVSSTGSITYIPIMLGATGLNVKSEVKNNVIQNISVSSIGNVNNFTHFAAIRTLQTSWVDIIGNTIGSADGSSSIFVQSTYNHGTNAVASFGIDYATPSTAGKNGVISDNIIGSVTVSRTVSSYVHHFTGINVSTASSFSNTTEIFKNFITKLNIDNNISASTIISAIRLDNGLANGSTSSVRNVYNNIISLGSTMTRDCSLRGIYELGGNFQRTNNIQFNTIYLAGTPLSNTTATAALLIEGSSASNVRNIRNNIFFNERGNTIGTARHYGAYFVNTSGLTVDYNDYYAPNTNGTLGYHGGDITSLPNANLGGNSVNTNPALASAGGTNPLNYKGTVSMQGVTISGILSDFVGNQRQTPNIGAFEIPPQVISLIWNGNVSTDWNLAANWTPNYVPSSDLDVTIPAGRPRYPDINNGKSLPAQCKDMLIATGASVRISPNKALTVHGDIENKGLFRIASSSDGDGSLMILGNRTGSGSYRVQRYFTGNAWRMKHAPIQNATASIFSGMWLRGYTESTNTWGSFIVSPSYPLTVGQGFSVWTYNALENPEYNGIINHGTIPMTVTLAGGVPSYNRGFNLIGNPYPTAIQWKPTDATMWTRTNIASMIYIWDASSGNYKTWNGSFGSAGTGHLAIGQGFFVQASGANPALSINPGARLHSEVSFKSTQELEDIIAIKVSGNNYTDECYIIYREDASDSYDFQYDAMKMPGLPAAPQLYSKKNDNGTDINLAVNSLNNIESLHGKLVFLEVGAQTQYTLNFEHGMVQNFNPVIRDRFSNVLIQPNEIYTFTAIPSDNKDRFEITEASTVVVPKAITSNFAVWTYNNILYIDNLKEQVINQIQVLDVLGSNILNTTSTLIDLNFLPSGIYLVKVETNTQTLVQKIFIK